MAACPRHQGQTFFDCVPIVGFCRNALCFIAAPSISRRPRQRQSVVILCGGQKNGGLDLFKAAADRTGVSKELLHDGFFSFAVVRQQAFITIIYRAVSRFKRCSAQLKLIPPITV